MITFAIKDKHSAPASRRSGPSRFGYIGPRVKAQQVEIQRILRSTGAQAKLTIGQPNDKYEQEADRVADQVMAMPDPKLQRQPENEEEEETVQAKPLADQITPLVQRQEEPLEEEETVQAKFKDSEMLQRRCTECEEGTVQRQPEENEDEEIQAKSKPGEMPSVTSSLESRINSLKGGGQPLDFATRSFFEPRFGYNFSQIRVHSDSDAADTAKFINARAFTLGNHVVMGSGEYQPASQSGRRILGHELTHVVQQSRATPSPQSTVQRAAPAAALIGMAFLKRCIVGGLIGMAFDAAIQYGVHLWRLRRWPWERAREAWESYRHNWCATVLSFVLGCFGAIAAHRWVQPFLRRHSRLGGAAGATLLGRLLMWLATQGILLPRMGVKWLVKLGCIKVFEAESLSPGITSEEALSDAPEANSATAAESRE